MKFKGEIKHHERQYEENNHSDFASSVYSRITGNILGGRTETTRPGGCL
jgi:hypothetical protein